MGKEKVALITVEDISKVLVDVGICLTVDRTKTLKVLS